MRDSEAVTASDLIQALESNEVSKQEMQDIFESHAERVFSEKEHILTAVMPAAGEGSRMSEVTEGDPKELLEVGNPMVRNALEPFSRYNGEVNLNVVIRPGKEEIIQYLSNLDEQNVNISYSFIQESMGMAESLKAAEDHTKHHFAVTLPDSYFEERDFMSDLVEYHNSNAASATLGCTRREDSYYGALEVEDPDSNEGKVIQIPEDPESANSDLIVAGTMILDSEIYEEIEKIIESDNKRAGEYRLSTAINQLDNVNYRCIDCGEWYDVGTPERLEKARSVESDN